MAIKEQHCLRDSPNKRQHSNNFNPEFTCKLNFVKRKVPEKDNNVVETYITARLEVARKAARSYDFDNSAPSKKRGKAEEIDSNYVERLYHFFLGKEVNANKTDRLQWTQKDEMHPLFDKLAGSCRYVTEVQWIRNIWDKMLKETHSKVYLTVPNKPAIVTHVLLKKLQLVDWSTEEVGSEASSKVCVGVHTTRLKEQRARTAEEVHDVEMDDAPNPPNIKQSAIKKIFLLVIESITPILVLILS